MNSLHLFFLLLYILFAALEIKAREALPDSAFVGKYNAFSSDGVDRYFQATSIPQGDSVLRILAIETSTVEISKNSADEWRMQRTEGGAKEDFTFKLGEEFSETRLDGVKCKSIITRKETSLSHHRKCDGNEDNLIEWDAVGETLLVATVKFALESVSPSVRGSYDIKFLKGKSA